jgi:hypothetical protein
VSFRAGLVAVEEDLCSYSALTELLQLLVLLAERYGTHTALYGAVRWWVNVLTLGAKVQQMRPRVNVLRFLTESLDTVDSMCAILHLSNIYEGREIHSLVTF